MKPTKSLVYSLPLLVAAVGLLFLGMHRGLLHAGPQKPPSGDKEKALNLPGHLEAFEQVDLYSRVAGFIQIVTVDIGDRVKKGQILAELSLPEVEAEYKIKLAEVEQAKAEVEVAVRSVQAARAAMESVKLQVREAEAGVKSAQANLNAHKAQLERMRKLLESSAIDQALLDEVTHKFEAAKAGVEAAEAHQQAVKAGVEESLAQHARAEAMARVAEARLAVTRAEAQRTTVMLEFARIRAPFEGTVTRRTVAAGDFAQTPDRGKTQPLLVVARTDVLRMVIDVPENDVPHISVGTPAVVHFAALKDQEFKGKVTRLGGAIDRTNGTLRAEIYLPNPDGKLLPGMFGTVAVGK
ncbi:MAG TPA: efflux RND transporter periplasmic adaptor subunit [Gemmataceae bacterium]|jgi:multidrug resistance efflux pump|nr:efflux RND transporter periplasmic adaptor subunit [Gemmataceae bacterium]